jgi:hypothetical protein
MKHSEMETVMIRAMSRVALAAAVLCVTAAASLAQQATTETKAFEVLAVDGNQLIVKLPEGTRELTVPDDFRFNINGQQVSVRELKVGTKGTATITTRTTVIPVTVTEVKNGTVVQQSGGSVIVRTDEGVKMFSQGDIDKRGVKIMMNGKPAQLVDLHQGDRLSATIVTSKPPKVLTEKEVQATVAAAGPAPAARAPVAARAPAAPPAEAPRAAAAAPAPAAREASAAPAVRALGAPAAPAATLPATASSWPLLGLMSVLSLAFALALTIRRRRFVR